MEKHLDLISLMLNLLKKLKRIIDSVKLFSVVVNIGDSKSLITHPTSTTLK